MDLLLLRPAVCAEIGALLLLVLEYMGGFPCCYMARVADNDSI